MGVGSRFDGNYSRLASLSNPVGASTDLSLFSMLRKGRVDKVKILATGNNYSVGSPINLIGSGVDFSATISQVDSNGGIVGIDITNNGSGYTNLAEFFVDDPTGSNAVLKTVLGGGEMNLKATLGTLSSTVKIVSSPRSQLTERERWLNLYLDTIEERNDTVE